MTAIGPKECPNANDICAAFHLLVQALDRVGAVKLGAVLTGEGHVGEHIVFAGVHEVGQFRPAGAQLLGHLAPGLAGVGAVGLIEGLTDRGGDNRVLAA